MNKDKVCITIEGKCNNIFEIAMENKDVSVKQELLETLLNLDLDELKQRLDIENNFLLNIIAELLYTIDSLKHSLASNEIADQFPNDSDRFGFVYDLLPIELRQEWETICEDSQKLGHFGDCTTMAISCIKCQKEQFINDAIKLLFQKI